MYQVTGEIINVYTSPKSEKYDESFRLQLLGEYILKDGQVKKEMLTLGVPLEVYQNLKDCVGQIVSLPVGFFVQGGKLTTYYPKNGTALTAGRA